MCALMSSLLASLCVPPDSETHFVYIVVFVILNIKFHQNWLKGYTDIKFCRWLPCTNHVLNMKHLPTVVRKTSDTVQAFIEQQFKLANSRTPDCITGLRIRAGR